MSEPVKEFLRLRASKDRWMLRAGVGFIFLIGVMVGDFPQNVFFAVFRIAMILLLVFAIVVFSTAALTNKYDLILTPEGLSFGSFYGKQHYNWRQIKATGVIRPITGPRVFIELHRSSSDKTTTLPLRYLPDTYGLDADELAKTLLQWQREYSNVPLN